MTEQEAMRASMVLEIGFERLEVSDVELRAAQRALLTDSMDHRQRRLIDACVSYVAQRIPAPLTEADIHRTEELSREFGWHAAQTS